MISKPLQLMIALCIVQQGQWDTKPVFVILDAFNGAREVAERLLHEFTRFQLPVFFTSRQAALSFLKKEKFDHLFVDSDVGLKNFLMLASQKLANHRILIHVYEEGLGTYRTDLYRGLKKNIFDRFGIGTFFGSCRFVTDVYVFNTREYIDNIPSNAYKAREINESLSNFMMLNLNALKRLFGFAGVNQELKNNSNCSIYLTSWGKDKKFLEYLKQLNEDIFIKPHPHLKNYTEFYDFRVIEAGVPAELIIIDLMDSYGFVRVFDHQSSIRRYVSGKNLCYELVENK